MTDEAYALLVEEVRRQARGCCGDDAWRGHFCQYHNGYLDGAADAITVRDESEGADRGG